MKSIKAWAVIERKTGEIFRDSEDGGETWNLYIRLTRKECGELMDEYCAVPIEIREQSEIERLERENAQLKESQAKQFDYSYKLTVERQGLERQLELLKLHRRFHGKVGCSGLRGCYVCEAEEAQSQKGSK